VVAQPPAPRSRGLGDAIGPGSVRRCAAGRGRCGRVAIV